MNFDSFVLAASTANLSDEPAAREYADAIEFRMDLAASVSDSAGESTTTPSAKAASPESDDTDQITLPHSDPLSALEQYDGELPILVTNRPTWEGGEADDDGRLEQLSKVITNDDVFAIDVELESIRRGEATNVVERARDRGVKVVVSAHDFEKTPTRGEMERTLEDACSYGDVGKLAVTAESLDDTLSLLSVTRNLTRAGHDVATMAMGEIGSHTRAVAPVYGSKIGYAPVDPADATAPGQYDLTTLARLTAAFE